MGCLNSKPPISLNERTILTQTQHVSTPIRDIKNANLLTPPTQNSLIMKRVNRTDTDAKTTTPIPISNLSPSAPPPPSPSPPSSSTFPVVSNSNLTSSSSVIGLDAMIDAKRESSFHANVVHLENLDGHKIEEVYSGVHTGHIIGSGVSGVVRQVVHRRTGVTYAVKCMDLTTVLTDFALEQLKEEVNILVSLDHPNIVRLEEVYESKNEIYLVFEQLTGGELFDRLDEQPSYHYTETLCCALVQQMLSAVRYCHSRGIIHRDLKLENFIFEDRSPDSELKLIDFGLSKHFEHGDVQHEAVGTPYTVAPEVIRGSYTSKCDIWAIGVITYLLLSGDTPFGGCGGESLEKVRDNILKGLVVFSPHDVWSSVSPLAKTFIRDLLLVDPSLRPSASAAQVHPWIGSFGSSVAPGSRCLSLKTVDNLVTFKS
ncbi:hypothetical protein TrRE_jg12341, partial [Triparma retinervis]